MQIIGDKVLIKSTKVQDLQSLLNLWNDGRVMKWVGFPEGLGNTMEQMQSWYSKLELSESAHHYVVLDKENVFCGELFYGKDKEHKRAGLDIKFLPKAQGKGLAAESLKLLIDHIFICEKDIDAVWTEPSRDNLSARKLYAKCGLTEKERPDDLEPEDSYWELTRVDWEADLKRG